MVLQRLVRSDVRVVSQPGSSCRMEMPAICVTCLVSVSVQISCRWWPWQGCCEPEDAWKTSLVRPGVASESDQNRAPDLCVAIVHDQRSSQALSMPTVVVGSHGMLKRSRPAQVAAVKGHSSAGVPLLYTKSSSAGPRSPRCIDIFTPLQHLQNTLALVKIFQSNK